VTTVPSGLYDNSSLSKRNATDLDWETINKKLAQLELEKQALKDQNDQARHRILNLNDYIREEREYNAGVTNSLKSKVHDLEKANKTLRIDRDENNEERVRVKLQLEEANRELESIKIIAKMEKERHERRQEAWNYERSKMVSAFEEEKATIAGQHQRGIPRLRDSEVPPSAQDRSTPKVSLLEGSSSKESILEMAYQIFTKNGRQQTPSTTIRATP
jgi:hypothetical protein